MELLKARITNFASYSNLDFDFSNRGLCLVYGATGSGKSTLSSIPSWILYGVSAKGGSVDEIRNWKHRDQPTIGQVEVNTSTGLIKVTRVRGKPSENDLHWVENDSNNLIRGKDLQDTQNLLNQRLGMNADEFCNISTFNEFCEASSFFLAKVKDKRELFEKIAKLDLPIILEENLSEYKKVLKKDIESLNYKLLKHTTLLNERERNLVIYSRNKIDWEAERASLLHKYESLASTFIEDKNLKIKKLTTQLLTIEKDIKPETDFTKSLSEFKEKLAKISNDICKECGAPKEHEKKHQYETIINNIKDNQRINDSYVAKKNNLYNELSQVQNTDNHYLSQAEYERKRINPYDKQITQCKIDIAAEEDEINLLNQEIKNTNLMISSLETLKDLSVNLRSLLLQKAVSDIEKQANYYLEKYFDATLRVSFNLKESDKLEVIIQNGGYACSYTQLSKGQRQLLKIAFVLSVMKVSSNKLGIHMNTIILDEALDGLDSELKLKAFNLLQELSNNHSTVLVVDHAPEFHNLFTNKYHVVMSEDESHIENPSE